jgi:GcrA cell cycle regulator
MSAKRATWDSERIEAMTRCFHDVLSCSQIAGEIGVTRNAVIGKLHRLGLTRPRDIAAATVARRRAARLARPKTPRTPSPKAWHSKPWLPKRLRLSIGAQHEMLAAAFPAAQPRVEEIPIHNGRGCTLLELSQAQCRWPVGTPGAADFRFCGNEPVKGLSYCPGHARIAYRPTGRRSARG